MAPNVPSDEEDNETQTEAADETDKALDEQLDDIERRMAERVANVGKRRRRVGHRREPARGSAGQERVAAADAGADRVAYRADVVTSPIPASLRIRWRPSESAIEMEAQVSNSPMETGPESFPLDDEFLNVVALSRRLPDDLSPLGIATIMGDIQHHLGRTLPAGIMRRLSELPAGTPLTLRVDRELLDIPWEFAHVPGTTGTRLMDLHPTGRIAVAPRHSPTPQPRVTRDRLRLLVFGDPDLSLRDAGVNDTLDAVESALENDFRDTVSYEIYRGPITKARALEVIGQGRHDVVFYMGHGCPPSEPAFVFAGAGQERLLSGGEIIRALEGVEAPRIWLANACFSARMTRSARSASPLAAMVLALASRGTCYVGTLWAIHDPAAVGFARGLLNALLQAIPLGRCVWEGRRSCYERGMRDDPDTDAFVLYGDPSTTVEIR